jgi:Putative DNA-binding domain
MAIQSDSPNDLVGILLRGHEAKDFDYKASAAWNEGDKKACCELVKDILAMANTMGGYIVIGVSETPAGYSFDGISDEHADSFDTSRLNRFIQNYADPPINALLKKIVHGGKTFVLIEVPPFTDTPHLCQKDYPGVLVAPLLYVRTANNESAPVKSPADFNSVIARSIRNRSDALLASFRAILTTGPSAPPSSSLERFAAQRDAAEAYFHTVNPLKDEEPLLGYLEFIFMPEEFEPARFDLEALRGAAERAQVTYTGWPFLYFDPDRMKYSHVIQDGWEMFIQDRDFGGFYMMDYWRLYQSGLLYYRTILRPSATETNQGRQPAADVRFIAMYVAQAIDCLTRLYDGLLADTESIALHLRVINTEGRRLVNAGPGMMPLWASYVCRIPEIVLERRSPLAEWRAAVVDQAVEMSREIYLRFNWLRPNIELARGAIQRMFARQL